MYCRTIFKKFMVGVTGSVVFKNDHQFYHDVSTAASESLILRPSTGGEGCPKVTSNENLQTTKLEKSQYFISNELSVKMCVFNIKKVFFHQKGSLRDLVNAATLPLTTTGPILNRLVLLHHLFYLSYFTVKCLRLFIAWILVSVPGSMKCSWWFIRFQAHSRVRLYMLLKAKWNMNPNYISCLIMWNNA